eukprot:TRINITY_DN5551_c0_g1_i1.p1 TRINITY_DN5551_c0_g1~~TRINITY_DN5551_c0_g1_i1.p1  ORF type:complete len:204 (+),score=49.05 TRINITY_DN5551_c0_g1_i1:81-692(+)
MDGRQYKVVLLGSSGSGKTSLVLRATKNQFSESSETTIGASYFLMSVVCQGKIAKLEIWDTAGQERYSFLSSMYYRGASVALVLFDITCRDSFDRAKSWVQEVANQIPDPIKTAVVLVGNKVDLESGRQIEQKEGEALAEQYQISYFETSARTGTNIVELFMHTAQEAIDLGCPIAVAKSPSALFISQESIEAKESEQSKCVC